MNGHAIVTAGAVFLGLCAFAPNSWAQFKVCNHSYQMASVAIGYHDDQYGWTSEGWWAVGPYDCQILIHADLSSRYYYLYAEGDVGGLWNADKDQTGGYFCVRKGKFTSHNSDFKTGNVVDCESGGELTKHFVSIDTKDAQDFLYTLTR